MVILELQNKTKQPYDKIRDKICSALAGCRAFQENEIIVSDYSIDPATGEVADDNKSANQVIILLGDNEKEVVYLTGEIAGVTKTVDL